MALRAPLIIMLYKVVFTFESADEVLKIDFHPFILALFLFHYFTKRNDIYDSPHLCLE